jgi:hypothetical protein
LFYLFLSGLCCFFKPRLPDIAAGLSKYKIILVLADYRPINPLAPIPAALLPELAPLHRYLLSIITVDTDYLWPMLWI